MEGVWRLLSREAAEKAPALICCPVQDNPTAPIPGCTTELCGFCLLPVWVGPSAPKNPVRVCIHCKEAGRLTRH